MILRPAASGGADPGAGGPSLPALRLHLLGGFGVWLDGRQVPESAFPRRKAMSLLKLLALQPGHQAHREQVLEHLWPDLQPGSASTQLYKAIHHVRQALATAEPSEAPDELLWLRGETLGIAAAGGVTTDIEDFEKLARRALGERDLDVLRQAVDLYSGDLLPSDLYESWAEERRDALRETFIDVLVDLGDGCLVTSRLAEAADVLRQAVNRDPTREDAHRALMLVYDRQGNRARALHQYQLCVEALDQELGVAVAGETKDLHQDILDERVQHVETSGRGPATELGVLPPLIGRRPELRVAGAFLDHLAHGRGAVLSVEGDAGLGKTRFAQEILRLGWRRHWHILFGAAHEQEGQAPYLPFVEALRRALWSDPAGANLIPSELAHAIPEIPTSASPVGVSDRLAAQSALFAGVLRFLTERTRTAPVILMLDDLHAADDGSLKLFHYLARETANLPLLLIGSWRPNEPRTTLTLSDVTSSLERHQILHRLTLQPLSEREHHALLEQALEGGRVNPELANRLYHASEGNALFAREMTRQLAADGRIAETGGVWSLSGNVAAFGPPAISAVPRSLRALAARRLELLSPTAAQLVQLAAVIGSDVALPVLERGFQTGAMHDTSFLDLIDEALASGLLVEAGLDLRFQHSLLREAIYEQLSRARQTALHSTVATTLEALHAEDPERLPVDTVAYHYRQTGNFERAIHYLIQAGDRAEAVYDHDGALSRYGEALSLLDDSSGVDRKHAPAMLHERIGDVRRAIGDVERSLGAYLQALDAISHSALEPDRERRFTLHRKITLGAILAVNMPVAAEHLAHTRELAGDDPVDRARQLIVESLFHWHALQFETAREYADRALELAEQADAAIEASQAYEMLAIAHMALGNWDESLRCELRRQTPDWSPEIAVAIDAHLCLYQYKLHSEESLQQVRQFIEVVAQQSSNVGNLRCLAVCHLVLGNLALLQGQPETAAESTSDALDLHELVGSPSGMAYAIAQQATLMTAAGVFTSVPQLVEQGMEIASRAAIRDHCLMQLHTAGIHNLLEAGDASAASAMVEAAVAHDAASAPCAVCRVNLCEALAAYHLSIEEPEVSLAYIDDALQLADFAHNGPGRARLVRMRGHVHMSRGEHDDAERCYSEAAGIFHGVGDRYDLARTLQALGTLPDYPGSEALLQQAEEVLSRYHAPALANAMRTTWSDSQSG